MNSNYQRIKGGQFAGKNYPRSRQLNVPGANATSYFSQSDFTNTYEFKNVHTLKLPQPLNIRTADNTPRKIKFLGSSTQNVTQTTPRNGTNTADNSVRKNLMTPQENGSRLAGKIS